MANYSWARWDRLMRVSHLYTGLFLVPWMTVYAISGFCLNHTWFMEMLQFAPQWKVVRETKFVVDAAFPNVPEEQADAILKHLGLEGPRRITQNDPSQMILYRPCATGGYRITWQRQDSRLVVQQQGPLSFYSFVNALHFQHGYDQPYLACQVWAATVDATTVSTMIWIVSGVYLWARRQRRRWLGGLCLIAGALLFAALVVLLCR